MKYTAAIACALLVLDACGTALPGEGGGGVVGDAAALAGAWQVTRTLVTSPGAQGDFPLPVSIPVGFRAQDVWTIVVSGQRGTLTAGDTAVEGTWSQSQWTFTYQLSPGMGLRDDATIALTATSPRLRGTMTHRYTNGQRTWIEVWTVDGARP